MTCEALRATRIFRGPVLAGIEQELSNEKGPDKMMGPFSLLARMRQLDLKRFGSPAGSALKPPFSGAWASISSLISEGLTDL